MLNIFIRVIIIYIFVLIVMRLMGKREIGQMQPFELVIAIMIADLASVPMSDIGIPITNGIVPILALLLLQLIIATVNLKSMRIRKVLCGAPSILINKGKIDEKVLRKEKLTVNELQEKIRQNNIFNIEDVEYAILETSGQVTIIQKSEKRNVTPKDLGIVPEYEGIPYDLVVDGKIMNDNLKKLNKNYDWIKNKMAQYNVKPEEALIITIDGNGKIFYQKKTNIKERIV